LAIVQVNGTRITENLYDLRNGTEYKVLRGTVL